MNEDAARFIRGFVHDAYAGEPAPLIRATGLLSPPRPGRSILSAVTLMELHRLGIEVHLDDFGTGYSSLGYLQRFPVDTLKIDRSFISSDASAAVRNPEIVQTITSLARSLSLKTTAEGIETAEQLAYLRSLGCTHGQGYYFSRPLGSADAAGLIAGWSAAQRAELTGQANVSSPT